MKNASIINEIEDLLKFEMKLANRIGNKTLQITVPRAKLLLDSIRDYKSQIEKSKSKHITKDPAWFDMLDKKLLENF
jgi:hypothetical protein